MVSIDLAVFLSGSKYNYSYNGIRILLRDVNILPQPRKTFEDLEELSEDISQKGMLNPPTVARFTRTGLNEYIEVINILWRTSFSVDDFSSTESEDGDTYYVLLAGERRIRACRILWAKSARKKIEVRICKNIPPLAALFLQFSENTHKRVPAHEEAYAYSQLFNLIRQEDSSYPLARFARQVGRSPSTIKSALRFCDLPLVIQQAVEDSLVSYGIAVEIARIQEHGEEDVLQLEWWLARAVIGNHNVTAFQELVTEYIRKKDSGQTDMFDIFEGEQAELLKRSHRAVANKHMVQGMWFWIEYFNKLLTLFEAGKLGKEDSPFSEKSPLRILKKLVGILSRIDPHLISLMSPEELQEAQVVRARVDNMATILLKDKEK